MVKMKMKIASDHVRVEGGRGVKTVACLTDLVITILPRGQSVGLPSFQSPRGEITQGSPR